MNYWLGREVEMTKEKSFGEVLEAAEELSLEDQEELMNVLSRRIAERRRDIIVRDIRSARGQFRKGSCRSVTPDELISEILS